MPCSRAASGCGRSSRSRARRSSGCRRRRRSAPPRRSSASTPTASSTTTCRAWTTTTFAAASRPCTSPGTRRRRCSSATGCRRWPSRSSRQPQSGIDPRIQARLVLRLAQAAGPAGMVGGQAFDIAAEKAAAPLDLEQIGALQALKTGALFGWAAESGAHPRAVGSGAARALCRGARRSPSRSATTSSTSRAIPRRAGKRLGKDGERNKATFVSLLGLDGARARAADARRRGLRGARALRLGGGEPPPRRAVRPRAQRLTAR